TSLASQAYNEIETENTLQVSDSQILGAHVVDDTRFRYRRDKDNIRAQSSDPTTQVLGFFSGGGSVQGTNLSTTDSYELQNYTSIAHGKHFIKFGLRTRVSNDSNYANA